MSRTADIETPSCDPQFAGTAPSPWTDDGNFRRTFRDYQIYGISVRCEIPLSFPEQPLDGDPDVSLYLTSEDSLAKVTVDIPPTLDTWYQHATLPDGSDYVRWRGLFEFVISPDGHSIACRKLEQASIESFRTYLFGQVISFALVKQGHEPLHSTAVAVRGKAVAFLGDSGYGKSTLAAAFLYAGYPVLTDDLLLIREIDGTCVGFPGPARLKLYPEVVRRFLPQQDDGTRMNPEDPKVIIPLEPHQVCATPLPVHAFYLLDAATDGVTGVSLTPLSGRESLVQLIRSTFNTRLVTPKRLQQQFLAARQLLPLIPVNRISYPREFGIFPQVIEAILFDIRTARAPLGP